MNLYQEIEAYKPYNIQEEHDKKIMLKFIRENEDYLDRTNLIAHFSASIWTLNKAHTKVLMVYHNIYDSWSWIGGHADGIEDLRLVALRELEEETGIHNARLIREEIFSLEILTVNGHIRKEKYVPSHLHLNITFLAEADELEEVRMKPDENKGVQWFSLEDALKCPKEAWMIKNVYKKLIEQSKIQS
ncbi:MAG: NUDIX hydrolase [Anaeroplasmataceae bacterium]|nr:NUDIX hydrolase [Anaeroplasmataceae bacterium]